MSVSPSIRLIPSVDRWLAGPPKPRRSASGATTSDGVVPAVDDGTQRVWLRCPDGPTALALGGLLSRLTMERPEVEPVITVEDGDYPPGMRIAGPGPGDTAAAVGAFLDKWAPAAAVMLGRAFLPSTLQALKARGVPVIAAGQRMPQGTWLERRIARPFARRQLASYDAILAEDQDSLDQLLAVGAPEARSSVGGVLAPELKVPGANEGERESLSDLISSRPIWCAANLPSSELDTLVAAQRLAQRRSHRLLLVIVPGHAEDGPEGRAHLAAQDVEAGLRSEGEDPSDDLGIYIADLGGELGLWLRLAPVCFIGGTLSATAASRSPMEAAALGSAIMHGPQVGGHEADYARLDAAGATRRVATAEEIADTVDELIAPDKAAIMAHAAWEVSSAGDAAAEVLLDHLGRLLDAQDR